MSELQHTLQQLHRELADARQLAPEERALHESAVRDIQQAHAQSPAPEDEPPEMRPVARS